MTNYAAARTHMVDSQIHTMGVTSDAILDAFRNVPREQFVPTDRMGVAYTDEDMAIGPGRYLVEPVTHARLLQAALPLVSAQVIPPRSWVKSRPVLWRWMTMPCS